MNNSYDDLDFCLDTLFDYVYDKKNCYLFRKIETNKIQLSNIKKHNDFDYKKIFNGKFNYLRTTDNKFIFERTSPKSKSCIVRLCYYDSSNTNINDMNRKELIDMKMNYLLSDMETPLILLPVMNFDVSLDDLLHVTNKIPKELHKNNFYVEILEHFHETQVLSSFLEDTSQFKLLFFQILYSLFCITDKYPSFRHNDLNLENIYVYRTNKEKKNYTIKNINFQIPNVDFEIRITNFNNSYIKNIAENNSDDKKSENQYYDVHRIFSLILNHIIKKDIMTNELRTFFDEIIPEKYRNANNFLDESFYEKTVGIIQTPMIILTKNNFFVEFIKDTIMKSGNAKISNMPEKVGSYHMKDHSIEYSVSSSSTTHRDSEPLGLARMKGAKKGSKKSVKGKRVLRREEPMHEREVDNSFDEIDNDDAEKMDLEEDKKDSPKELELDIKVVEHEREDKKKKEKKHKIIPVEDSSDVELNTEFEETEREEKPKKKEEKEEYSATSAMHQTEGAAETESEGGMNPFMKLFKEKPKTMSSRMVQQQDKLFGGISQLGQAQNNQFFEQQDRQMKKANRHAPIQPLQGMDASFLSKLPNSFEGALPDWMQQQMPFAGGMGPGMGGMGPGMMPPMQPGMMPPMQPGMMPPMQPDMMSPGMQPGMPPMQPGMQPGMPPMSPDMQGAFSATSEMPQNNPYPMPPEMQMGGKKKYGKNFF